MPSKFQKERSKNVVMMVDRRKGLLPSSKALGNDCWQEKNSKDFKKRLKIYPFSLLMIRG
jgi:hypothetical protein